MRQFSHTIQNKSGIDTAAANSIRRESSLYTSDINIILHDKAVNAKHIAALTELGAEWGDTVTFTAKGEDEKIACHFLKKLAEREL